MHRIARSPKQKEGKGPNGRGFCKWCEKEVPEGRRAWCDEECIDESRRRTDLGYQRRLVEERDKGICALCGIDTGEVSDLAERFQSEARDVLKTKSKGFGRNRYKYWPHGDYKDFLRAMGFTRQHVWEMDHILPVSEGGGGCGLENLRTLCIPCHDQETAKLKARLAAARRSDAQLDLLEKK